ncbi:hypothetical protein LCGC14_2694660 [marine sediment metagenome]|uniref:Uncharacterized protein n=1 Tax=marine sediment metagenome TaxID=412755 RepID=A0A0F9C987_9ZZZZ
MSFILHAGKTKDIKLPVTASTVLSVNSLVSHTSGQLVAATSSSNAVDILGVVLKAIVATDDDYTDERLISIRIPMERFTEWIADFTATLVVADVGLEVDLTDAVTLNRAASSKDIAKVKKVLSTTKGVVWISFHDSY